MSMALSPKCPNCSRSYSFSQAGLQPRILTCNHSLCRQCIVKLVRAKKDGVTCPKCKVDTSILKNDKGLQSLPVNLFLLGLACATTKQQINPFNHQLEFKAKPKATVVSMELKGGRLPCVSCRLGPAEYLCQHCDDNLCNECFITRHSTKAGRVHVKVSLLTDKVYGCPEHKNLPRDFYCQDDNEPVCAKCGLVGKHKGHDILHVQDMNCKISKEVEPAMNGAVDTLKKLYYSKEAADAEELRLMKRKEELRDKLEEKFAELSAELQLKFLAIQESYMSAADEQLDNLCQIRSNLEGNICRLTTVMEDVKPWLGVESKAPANLMEVITILRGACELPWFLSEGRKEEIELPFQSIADIFDTVDIEKPILHTLRSSAELPENFEVPVISDSILKKNPLFGDKKKQPKKKQNGPNPIRGLQQNNIAPADLIEHRASSNLTKDMKKTNKRQFVNVVHIKNPAFFVVQRQSDWGDLGRMMRSLTNICERIKDIKSHIPHTIQVGTKCCCKFEDGQWYRCMVRKVPDEVAGILSIASPADLLQSEDRDEIKVEVVYIDYGNTQWVPVTKLVRLKPKFEKMPTFAMICALYDIIPPDQKSSWPRESSEAFATMVATQDVPLAMSVHGEVNDILQVDLHQSPNSSVSEDAPESIRDALIFLELACFVNDTPRPKSPRFAQTKRYLPPELPCSGDSLAVTICNIVDPHHFYVHEAGVMVSSLSKMMEELQESYRKRDRTDWAVLCPHPGTVCVAKYANDDKWYRAQITGLPGKQQVEVLYVDYGNTAIVKVNLIRKITDHFLKLPIMALPCQLVDIVPKAPDDACWSREACFFFSQNTSCQSIEIHIYNDQADYLHVVAFIVSPNERQNVNALMVHSGYAASCGPASIIPEMMQPSPGARASPDMTESFTPKLLYHRKSASGRKKEMYTAVHVESPSCIYLQLATASRDGLDSLLEAMTLHYKDSEADMDHDWKEGDSCAALLAREGVWCRGQIVTFLTENNLLVLFTDYGNKETLALGSIRSLEESYRTEPPFALCCHLTGITPAGGKDWTQTACHYLQATLCDLDCYISKKGEEESSSLPVDLLYELTEQEMIDRNRTDELVSVSELLIREGLALRDRRRPNRINTDKRTPEAVLQQRGQLPREGPMGDNEGSSPFRDQLMVIGGGSPSPPRHDSGSGMNESGDSGIVNPDHTLTGGTSPCRGSSVDGPTLPATQIEGCGSSVDGGDFLTARVDSVEEFTVGSVAIRELNRRLVALEEDLETPELQEASNLMDTVAKETEDNIGAGSSRGANMARLTGVTPLEGSGDMVEETVDPVDDYNCQSSVPIRIAEVHGRSELPLKLSPDDDAPSTSPALKKYESPSLSPPDGGRSGGTMVESSSHGEPEDLKGVELYLPAALPEEEELMLAVSFVSLEGLVYGLNVESLSVLQPMMANLQKFCENPCPPTTPLIINQAVCAKFNLDNKWYRATVTEVFEETVGVMYIDFGNSEVIRLKDINIRPFRPDLPQQSLCCRLHRVATISPVSSMHLAQMITELTCTIVIKEPCQPGRPIVVDMFLPTNENVADLLISEGLVTLTETIPPSAPQNNSRPPKGHRISPTKEIFEEEDFLGAGEFPGDLEVLTDHPSEQFDPTQDVLSLSDTYYRPLPSLYQLPHFPLGGKEFLAEVPCVKTPDLVYLTYSTTFRGGPFQDEDLMSLYEKFAVLHAEINNIASTLPEIKHPRQGMPCLAYYKLDRQWYRGEIASVIEGKFLYCDVRFVDYGTIERLPIDRICQVPEKYLELPQQSRLCRLAGLRAPAKIPPGFPTYKDSRWPVASFNAMIQLIKNKIFLATILEDGTVPVIGLYSSEFTNGSIERGAPMFMSLIETGLADIGTRLTDYKKDISQYQWWTSILAINSGIRHIDIPSLEASLWEDGTVPVIGLYSSEFTNGSIERGAPMFMSLIETGLADIGTRLTDYTK